ncbi:MAG: hypothetical protein ABQ298_05090 [Puniceicoccaceae bacterium]
MVDTHRDFRCAVQPDQFLELPAERYVWIPDIENVDTLERETELHSSLRNFCGEQFSVGIFGSLTGSRCVHAFMELVRRNPSVRFAMVGRLRRDQIDPDCVAEIDSGIHMNLFVSDAFVESEAALNSAISCVHSVFIDSTEYLLQSGIVIKGLALGKFILSTPGNSWTHDLIRTAHVGAIVERDSEDLLSCWDEWRLNQGSAHNQKVHSELTDPKLVNASFDRIRELLTQN